MPRPIVAPRAALRSGLFAAALLLAAPASSSAQQLYDFGSAFGRAAAVVDGQLFVGQPQNVLRPGRVYVYEPGDDGWTETAVVTAPDGVRSDGFGRAIAADGEWLLVGAPSAADGAGATYLFRRSADGWSAVGRIAASPDATMAGSAVALAGGVAATVERSGGREAVRVLRWTGDALVEEAVLTGAPDDMRFGAALAGMGGADSRMGGELLGVCGADADGGAFLEVHHRSQDGEWASVGRYFAGAPLSQPGGLLSLDPYKECGLAAGEGRFVIGTPLAPGGGGVTVFGFGGEGSSLAVEGTLSAPEGAAGRLGTSVAVAAGPTVWAGAPNARGQLGAAARFSMVDGSWDDGTVLTGPGTDFMPVFGLTVAASGESAVVGSPGNDYGAGTAVTYRASAGDWAEAGSLAGEVEGYEAVAGEEVDCADGSAALFGCDQMDLVSLLPVESLGASRGAMVNDVWGWTDPGTAREYAVVGRSEGTSFVDVTNPSNPIYLGQLPKTEGSRGNAW
ncbi:MAG: hypothetical protein HKN71_06745, partial [Gemmatimonadetes bacterium]|nr:hypothetical protein [Gemmatimonadota bacterium]